MNKIKYVFLTILFPLSLTSCFNNTDYITYKEYIDIVKTSVANQKDIFIFTSSTCNQCKKIESFIKDYKNNIKDINVYELSVDYKSNLNGTISFKDKTMGYLTGDSSNDGIKQLDNRLSIFVNETNSNNSSSIIQQVTGNYIYMCTPLILFYDSGMEVQLINNVDSLLLKDSNGNYTYESFKEMMTYPDKYPSWNKVFDLISF